MAEEAVAETVVAEQDGRPITMADLIELQQSYRDDVAALRAEIAKSRVPVAGPTANAPTPEEALAARMAEVDSFSHYCPGCGKLYKREAECVGSPAAPHPAIEVVSTDELKSGDPTQHTAAPSTAT